MNRDPVEELLKDAIRQEIDAASSHLADFEQRVVDALGDRAPRLGLLDWLKQMVAPTRKGRWGQLVVIAATAAAFLIVGAFVGKDWLPAARQAEPMLGARTAAVNPTSGNEAFFILPALNAENVSVVGSFNEWEPTPLSDENGDGIWTASIPLPPGRYEYAFVIDGRWWGQDPLADEYIKSFGEYSSVRYVGGGGDGA